jgi:AcrR family transcriptional regulator
MGLGSNWYSVPYRELAMDDRPVPLRARKQQRTRDSVVEAAMALFDERGFEAVTVADIAAAAEVGRTTFFRYFADKQEVLFADDEELRRVLVTESERVAATVAPIGSSLTDALLVTRAGLRALTERTTKWSHRLALAERLIGAHPELAARALVKQHGYVRAGTEVLIRHGATPETATLAAGIAAACYNAGQAGTVRTGRPLLSTVDRMFRDLAGLDGDALRAGLRARRH